MRSLLEEAVTELNLAPGETYRATVKGVDVQIHRPAEVKPTPAAPPVPESPADEEPSQFADMVMLNVIVNMPPSPNAITVTARCGEPILPSPIVIDESDLAPE